MENRLNLSVMGQFDSFAHEGNIITRSDRYSVQQPGRYGSRFRIFPGSDAIITKQISKANVLARGSTNTEPGAVATG